MLPTLFIHVGKRSNSRLQDFFLPFNHFAFTEICKELKLQGETSGSN